MFGQRFSRRFLLGTSVAAGVALVVLLYSAFHGGKAIPEVRELRQHVRETPPVPVVFTSRSEPASFEAPAPEAEGFTYPGTIPWTAREGRLRLLDTDGKVYELTWNRKLADGTTLIDVMSPSVSLDGQRVLFAGRKAAPDPGRWRIYEVGIDGGDLRQLTGGPDDPGCIALPPMRYAADGSVMSPEERKRIDYDDIDPAVIGPGAFVFASSRLPDLGRDHSRRSTQLWKVFPDDPKPRPFTANRNNDRWPFVMTNQAVLFSLWSRNRESVTADGNEVSPWTPQGAFSTRPTDLWVGARLLTNGDLFGYSVKVPEPVWRPRQLFDGGIVFMSPAANGRLRIGKTRNGHLRVSPSSLQAGMELPSQMPGGIGWGPERDAEGQPLSAATPSPCPSESFLFAGAVCDAANAPPVPSRYGIYLVAEDRFDPPKLLFDDPSLVDAEPVAVYHRDVVEYIHDDKFEKPGLVFKPFTLADGREYSGTSVFIDNPMVKNSPAPNMPSNATDTEERMLFPPPQGVESIVFYASHRDRFDDPTQPRIPGKWEKLLVLPVENNAILRGWVPASPTAPTVLAGLDANGKVFRWESEAKDSRGRRGTYYAIAGDHYSGRPANGYAFCQGCHTGHTFQDRSDLSEKQKK